SCGEYLVRVAGFVDDLLERLYGLGRFYAAKSPEDLLGHLVVTLAPHTSGGVLARIVGFTDANACFAHPYLIAARRRNCDGDEDSVILLLDCLVNFSRAFLPDKRGGLMDAPLVLTTRIDPNEIDKEAHNLDVMPAYPTSLYEVRGEVPPDSAPREVPCLRREPDANGPRKFGQKVPRDLEADQPAVRGVELSASEDRSDRGRDHVVVHERQDAGPEARRFLL